MKQSRQRLSHFQSSSTASDFSGLQSQFLQMLQVVMESFDRLPNSLGHLKQVLGQLTLPLGEGKTLQLVNPSRYEKAITTRELFRQQSVLWNSFSPDLLKILCEDCQCSPAMEAVEQFILFRSKFANSLICQQTQSLDDLTSTSISPPSLHPSHLACHTGPIDDLQSLHPSVFQRLDEHKRVDPRKTIRLTVHVDRPHLTLQDFDDITTTVCGYFEIPRAALRYGGCSRDGHVVCWMTSATLLPYVKNVSPRRSSHRLMAEQRMLGVAAGDLQHRCLRMKVGRHSLDMPIFSDTAITIMAITDFLQEMELHEAVFYGQIKRVQMLLQQNAPVNAVDKVY